MTAVISRLNLNKTKLEKKPDYEEILNVIHPDVKVHIPNRKSSDYFKSHFNITYGNLSDERVKQMEHQLLVEKFSKANGFNKAAVDALLHANNLTTTSAFQTPASGGVATSQSDDDDDGNEGGGMGGIMRVAKIASNFLNRVIDTNTVANYIQQYLGRGNPPPSPPEGGAASFNIASPQLGPSPQSPLFGFQISPNMSRNFLLLGSNRYRRRQIERGDYGLLDEEERRYLSDLLRYQEQAYIPPPNQLYTPNQQMPPMNLFGAFTTVAQDEAAQQPVSDTPIAPPSPAQPAAPLEPINQVDIEANRILQKDANENVQNEDEDFDSTILKIYSEAHGIAVSGLSRGRKDTAQRLINKIDFLRDELGTAATHKALFMRIIATEEYEQFLTILRSQDMTTQERRDYENELHRTYLQSNPDVQRAMKKWNHIKEIIYRKNRGATHSAQQLIPEPKRSGRARSMGATAQTRRRGNDGLPQATEQLPPVSFSSGTQG